MAWDEQDKRIHISTIQSLQKQIIFLQKAYETIPEPSIGRSIQILKGAQNKLYGSLVKHGMTAEEMAKIIAENNGKQLIKNILKLQKAVEAAEQQLAGPHLSPQKRKSLENSLAQKSREYASKWDEIINSPHKEELVNKIEQAQRKASQKSRKQSKTRTR